MKKNLYKAALVAALGLAGITAAQAQIANNDLILGFTSPDAASVGGVQYDYTLDLGQLLGQNPEEVFVPGYQEAAFTSDLGSAITSGEAFAGVFGATSSTSGDVLLSATSLPATEAGSDLSSGSGFPSSVFLGPVPQSGQSVYDNISKAPGEAGANNNSFALYVPSPLEAVTSAEGTGDSVLDLEVYEATYTADGLHPPTGSAYTDEGFVSVLFGADGDIQGVAWDQAATVEPMPEASSFGIFTAGGLLLLGFRHRFTSKTGRV